MSDPHRGLDTGGMVSLRRSNAMTPSPVTKLKDSQVWLKCRSQTERQDSHVAVGPVGLKPEIFPTIKLLHIHTDTPDYSGFNFTLLETLREENAGPPLRSPED